MSMRSGLEQWLMGIWYARPRPPWYLRMLVPAYRAGFAFDHRASKSKTASRSQAVSAPSSSAQSNSHQANNAQLNSTQADCAQLAPVIVVGNITVGGSGKTPLVIALTRIAQEMQLTVGIATTGYGRHSDATFHVLPDSDPLVCGDEPVLLSIRTHASVVVARRRADAVAELNQLGVDLIISDDGLQTAGLQRDLEICVVDGARGLGNGYLLPAGPLREPIDRLRDVDCIVSNGKWIGQTLPFDTHLMTLAGSSFHCLDGSRALPAEAFFRQEQGGVVHGVAAIGNPERFFKSLRQMETDSGNQGMAVIQWCEHRFADHHVYTLADFDRINGAGAVVMTEKDAVKCRKMGLQNAWYLPVEAELSGAFTDWFRQQLLHLKVEKT